jgi:diacylglycerol kinase family enzyme
MSSVRQVGILFNPRAGRGEASSFASSISVYLTSRGLRVRTRESSRKYQESDIQGFLLEADALVIVGGDGTFRDCIPYLKNSLVPTVLYPAGNESLLARKFQVTRSIPDLYDRIERLETEQHYFGICNSMPFFLMAGMGFDSAIVKKVHEIRSLGSSNLIYIKAFLKTVLSYKPPVFSLDSEPQVSSGCLLPDTFSGACFVGNSSMYARNFLPVPEASSLSGDMVFRFFMEDKSSCILRWVFAAVFNRPLALDDSALIRSRELKFSTSVPVPLQLDGDYAGDFKEFSFSRADETISFLV